MPSKFERKIEDLKDKAFHIALIPLGIVSIPITYYFRKKRLLRQELAKDVLISSEWTVLTPKPPLEIKKMFQSISLRLTNCQKTFGKYHENLMFSDGTVINPTKQIMIEIFDQDGNKYEIRSNSNGLGNIDENTKTLTVGFKSYRNLPDDKTLQEIRIRCEKPVHVKRISWHDFDPK